MKRTGIAAFLIILALAAGLTLFNRCSGGDMARVTINFDPNAHYDSSMTPLIDKFLKLITTKAFAFSVWDSVYNEVSISISGAGMSPIDVLIPPTQTSYTTEVPSGPQRSFTVYGINNVHTQGKNWGGSTTSDLTPGGEVTLTINMIPIPTKIEADLSMVAAGISITWYNPSGITGYYIYRSNSENGPYSKIATVTPSTITSYLDPETNLVMDSTYFYKISSYNANGESPLSDPVSQLFNP